MSDEFKRRLADTFSNRVDYDEDHFHKRLADRVVALASPQLGDRVLDIATGTGLAAIAAAHRIGPTGNVVGVDISQGMLDRAKQAIASEGLKNIELALADAEALTCPANSFDIVLCASALPYMTDVPAALRLWHSLLKPGGRLAFNCWSEQSYVTGDMVRTVAARHSITMPVTGEQTGTPDRCRAVLTNAGFCSCEVVVEPSEGRMVTMEQVQKAWDVWLKNPIFYPRNPADAKRLSHLRNEYLEEARNRATDGGVWDEMTAFFVAADKPA